MKILYLLLTIGTLSWSCTAHAILDWDPCAADVKTHCAGLTLGSDAAGECLAKLARGFPYPFEGEERVLTDKCNATVRHWQFHRACKSEVEKFCSKIVPGESRIHQCIRKNADKVGPTCSSFIKEYLGVGMDHDLDC